MVSQQFLARAPPSRAAGCPRSSGPALSTAAVVGIFLPQSPLISYTALNCSTQRRLWLPGRWNSQGRICPAPAAAGMSYSVALSRLPSSVLSTGCVRVGGFLRGRAGQSPPSERQSCTRKIAGQQNRTTEKPGFMTLSCPLASLTFLKGHREEP